jgi:hypothetical protein
MHGPSTSESGPKVHVFVDLDDTLFRSKRKATGVLGRIVATKQDGSPYSYMSPQSERFFQWLGRADRVIPNTARTIDALERVDLHFTDYRICALGGAILDPHGQIDAEWDAVVRDGMAALEVSPSALAAELKAVADEFGSIVRILRDAGRDVYLSIRHPARDDAALAALAPRIAERIGANYRLRQATSDLVVRPRCIGKDVAQAWLRANRLEAGALAIGVGDRLDDADFMGACDFAITPPTSDIWAQVGHEF